MFRYDPQWARFESVDEADLEGGLAPGELPVNCEGCRVHSQEGMFSATGVNPVSEGAKDFLAVAFRNAVYYVGDAVFLQPGSFRAGRSVSELILN